MRSIVESQVETDRIIVDQHFGIFFHGDQVLFRYPWSTTSCQLCFVIEWSSWEPFLQALREIQPCESRARAKCVFSGYRFDENKVMKTHTSPWQAGRNVEALIYSALNEQRDPAEDLWGTESQTQKERQEMQLRKKTGVSERILLSHAQHQMLFSRSRFLQLRDLCLAWASRQ